MYEGQAMIISSARPQRVPHATTLASVVILTLALYGCGGSKAYLSSSASSCAPASTSVVTDAKPATVLNEAFKRARVGAFARPDLVINAISVDGFKPSDVSSKQLKATLNALQPAALALQKAKAHAAGKASPPAAPAPNEVWAILVSRVPWLANYPESLVPDDDAGRAALVAAVGVIEFAGKKQAALQARGVRPSGSSAASEAASEAAAASATPAAIPPSMTPEQDTGDDDATYSRKDHDMLQHAWQNFAGLQPFHLLTLFAANRIIATFNSSSPPNNPEQIIGLVRLFNIANFLATYFDAYFGEGQFIQVSLERKPFIDDVVADLKRSGGGAIANEDGLRKALDKACTGTGATCFSAGAISTTGFVSLFGDTTQFGEVKVDFGGKAGSPLYRPSISHPGVAEFGPQLVRVLVEAVADANGPHPPGAPTSTACSGSPHLFVDADAPGQCLAAASAENDAWTRINLVGNATESIVTTGVGGVIRGVNMGALNNETVASVVETFAGVTARKTVQKAMSACVREQTAANGKGQPATPSQLPPPPHVQVTNYAGPLDQ
jgi:hypothetical protein